MGQGVIRAAYGRPTNGMRAIRADVGVLWYEGYGVAMCGASYDCQMLHSVRPVHLRDRRVHSLLCILRGTLMREPDESGLKDAWKLPVLT